MFNIYLTKLNDHVTKLNNRIEKNKSFRFGYPNLNDCVPNFEKISFRFGYSNLNNLNGRVNKLNDRIEKINRLDLAIQI